jgi:protease-4
VIFNAILILALIGTSFKTTVTETVEGRRYDEIFITGEKDASDKILCIPVAGIIMRGGSFLWRGSQREDIVDSVINALKRAQDDSQIKAIILRVNSPGGGITECDQIHKEIIRFKEKRPDVQIIAFMDSVAASGGYYISAPAHRIVATPTTLTGSIGVIIDLINIEGLYEKLGLKDMVFKSGAKKDMGSATREITDEEKEIFQGIINEMYQRFVKVVDEGRKNLDETQVLKLADGRIYTGVQALQNGLVDELGDFKDSIEIAKRLVHLTRARVIEYKKHWNFFEWLETAIQHFNPQLNLVAQINELTLERYTPRFLYLWAIK